jgi:hypothetical protein
MILLVDIVDSGRILERWPEPDFISLTDVAME